MNALVIVIVTFLGYLIAYHTYGRYLARHIFQLDPNRPVPSQTLRDGQDYVPTKKSVIFGHHFTSIAGTGPIVGPAIGIIWGWGPALLWIFVGSIVMGAVHDFAALVMSLRHEGKSIADLTENYINPRVRILFFLIVFLALLIVIAIFGLVIALIFAQFPEAVFPVWMEIPISLGLGYWVYKKNGNLIQSTAIAVLMMYVTVIIGHFIPILPPSSLGIPPTGLWTIILLVYAFIASVLPVTTLLQPRDYINAWQLFIALGVVLAGIVISGGSGDLIMVAPTFNPNPEGAPLIWPFLFITIACGAISGFHALVSSGTSSKQLASESDAQFVGYGSMILEAALATVVIVAVGAGIGLAYNTGSGSIITGVEAWSVHYQSWAASAGLGSKLKAVVVGSANIIAYLGIPTSLGVVIMGVFIASFAGTTLDTSTRLQRYIVSELFSNTRFRFLKNKFGATAFAVSTAALLAFSSGASGKGALALWPLFGAVNQLLAALALMVATVYLQKHRGWAALITGIPCVFMLGITTWASILNQIQFYQQSTLVLLILNTCILVLSLLMVSETVLVLYQQRQAQSLAKTPS
ncbi:carbon starvation protein A [Candidatus Marinamargulisbacteria bacterium SCGC AG-439-L15]|nr:carbon starvation protein A [Candidatus Marinamargulisbacteria bacterium SCGC AG-439-L15]